ncbi:fumarylacetoacetate (FAA) hydrolase family protein [Saccharopolyspora erythraea NRRL 2338]|uniref:Fumarylacetoacetate hydrolase n=2 Tax=Saccharopolyspora erythraea TaxID=1836 RepID=A4FF60_SACEN|nr:fumarylacetoacetate hydrolase family protein [Saccharopolyspora erythraea]EQD86039.1 fumarylacetoacetate hydrolase [Saccharopolyspora erythraea D]PFG96409.1 fumarylacetoacetate (FAA) hydrolase family protein [Saccharopolyspora erythraea NRRL 2338]QRK92912.1 fumarylacetoacetate hydrolase family protein [Saccharopolyspora erythraea]CAM02685.1 fumarylacetoacetate hydrolase [Saccharopolyspora erythraea NRRL 2338]
MSLVNNPFDVLPADWRTALLVGRVHDPDEQGPSVVVVAGDELLDISGAAPTLSQLLESEDPAELARTAQARKSWPLAEVLDNTLGDRTGPHLLAPADLQVIKAAGVTFVRSMLERVIEERAAGDPDRSALIRAQVEAAMGGTLAVVDPGSPEAAAVKEWMVRDGLWSQYLEVGLGPDPEVFTKAPVLAAVGTGAEVGVAEDSRWNNPEPELVLAVRSDGRITGATLGNDVNLRDVEGRSALLLPKAKDNNASAALGPFLRLFDDGFGLDDVRRTDVRLEVVGEDGFVLDALSSMREISRDVLELVAATVGRHHQYPDGIMLYTGTLFAPTEDRDAEGAGFTHHLGDVVRISSPRLGTLANRVNHAEKCPEWTFGIGSLMTNLAARGLLG